MSMTSKVPNEDKKAGGKPPMSRWTDKPVSSPANAHNEMPGRDKAKAKKEDNKGGWRQYNTR